MRNHVVQVTYHGPTDTLGSRYRVLDLRTYGAKPTTVYYDYAQSDMRAYAVRCAFENATAIEYGGEDARHTYYIVSLED